MLSIFARRERERSSWSSPSPRRSILGVMTPAELQSLRDELAAVCEEAGPPMHGRCSFHESLTRVEAELARRGVA